MSGRDVAPACGGSFSADGLAATLLGARAAGRLLAPISDSQPLTMEQAYAVQRAGLDRRLRRGERQVGWKLGYTSAAMRQQMGVDAPNFGPLTDAMRGESGVDVAGRLTHPRVEPEIAVIVDAHGEVAAAYACLEVVDSVFAEYRFTLADNTADGSSAGMFVVGGRLADKPLAEHRVVLEVDGRMVAAATGAAADGDPRLGLRWLTEQGVTLSAGDVVLTGGLTKAYQLMPGMEISAVFDDTVRVVVRRGREDPT